MHKEATKSFGYIRNGQRYAWFLDEAKPFRWASQQTTFGWCSDNVKKHHRITDNPAFKRT